MAGGAVAVLLAALCWRAFDVLAAAFAAVSFPLSLDYGEGIVIQQALLMTTSRAYGDITTAPFIVFHYPPVYHLAIRAAASTGADIVMAARLVSIGGAGLMACAVGWLVTTVLGSCVPRVAKACGTVAGAAAVLLPLHTANWVPMARVDMLAIGLTLAGLATAAAARGSRRVLALAVILLVAAVFTKQTTVAAPIAVVGVLLVTDRRQGFFAAVLGLSLGLAGLAVCQWLTDGRFLEHIVFHNVNRYSFAQLLNFLATTQWYVPLFLAAVIGIALRVARQPRGTRRDSTMAPLMMLVVYVAIGTALVPLAGKVGASYNYFIEWFCGFAALTGVAIGEITLRLQGRAGRPSLRLVLLSIFLAVAASALTAVLPDARHILLRDAAQNRRIAQDLIAKVRASDGDFISDDMLLNLRAGRPVLWEAAIFSELASHGRWDERLIIDAIRDGRFAMAVTEGDAGDGPFELRYRPAVAAAMRAAWPVRLRIGWLTFHLPPE